MTEPVEKVGGVPPAMYSGETLEICSITPMTGFYRDGCCNTGREDMGSHTVCAVMTAAFLEFSKSRGNDLSTPLPEFGFPGLKPGDRWCLCAPRWQEAEIVDRFRLFDGRRRAGPGDAGAAPRRRSAARNRESSYRRAGPWLPQPQRPHRSASSPRSACRSKSRWCGRRAYS